MKLWKTKIKSKNITEYYVLIDTDYVNNKNIGTVRIIKDKINIEIDDFLFLNFEVFDINIQKYRYNKYMIYVKDKVDNLIIVDIVDYNQIKIIKEIIKQKESKDS